MAACSNPSPPGHPSTGSPPVVLCGRTLYSGAVGLPVYRPPLRSGTYVNPMDPRDGPPLLVETADGCSHGSHIAISPPGIVAVITRIDAADGLPVAIALSGVRPGRATLTVTGPGDIRGTVPLVVVDPSGAPGQPTNGVTVP